MKVGLSLSNRSTRTLIVMCVFLFFCLGHVSASPIRLRHGNLSVPFLIFFPVDYVTQEFDNPALPGTKVYVFTGLTPGGELSFGASIMAFPMDLGRIGTEEAMIMTSTAVGSQVDMMDYMLGDRSTRGPLRVTNVQRYTHHALSVNWNTEPPLFGRYLSFVRNRDLVSVWVSGVKNETNETMAELYFMTLIID